VILSVVTVGLIGAVVYLARADIVEAFRLATRAKIGFLLLLVPLQALMYFAAGQVYFSYLSAKGQIKYVNIARRMRLALELNFVKNIIPAGGVAGVGYMAWRLKSWGLKAGPAALAQMVRYLVVLLASIVLIFIASARLIWDGAGWLPVLLGVGLSVGALLIILVLSWILGNRKRIDWAGQTISRFVNFVVRILTFGRKKRLLTEVKVDEFLGDMHKDFVELLRNKKALVAPLLWAAFYVICDTATFFVVFLALGVGVDFGAVLIAQILASVVGTVVQTPGNGAGFYEATMTGFFALLGVPVATALAAALMTRIAVLLGTIIFGWAFYQHALTTGGDGKKDGKGVKMPKRAV
jgi:uncharacterized protein (TIRG00374 family)